MIFGEDLEKIFGKRPWGDTIELMADKEEETVEVKKEDEKKEDTAINDNPTDANAEKPDDSGTEKG